MASYDASINVRVSGTSMVEGVINRVQELERLVRDVNTRPINLARPFGRGEMADRFSQAARELNGLKNSFINSENAVQEFGTTAGRTIANTTQLARAFKQIADNSDIATAQFREFTVATQQAAVAANALGRARLTTLANELSFGGRQGATIGGGTLVQELLAQRTQIPNSIAALEAYQGELIDLQRIVRATSPEFRQLERAVYQLDVALGRAGQFGPAAPPVQGPALPPNFTPPPPPPRPGVGAGAGARGGPPPGSLAFNPNPSQENLALGAGFPLLFGGGPAQVLGGLAGSMFGAGFGGQILGSAIAQQLSDVLVRVKDIGSAAKTLNMDALRDSVVYVNAELETSVRRLVEIGKAEEARAALTKAAADSLGLTTDAMEDVNNATKAVQGEWDQFVGAITGTLAIIGAPFAAALAGILKVVTLLVRGFNAIQTYIFGGLKGLTDWFLRVTGLKILVDKVGVAFGFVSEEQQKLAAALQADIDKTEKQLGLQKGILDLEKQRTRGYSQMERLKNIDIDKSQELLKIEAAADEKKLAIREQYKGLNDKDLAVKLQQVDAEKAMNIETLNLNTKKQITLELSKKTYEAEERQLEALRAQQTAVQAQSETYGRIGSIVSARITSEQTLASLQGTELERRYETATTEQKRLDIAKAIFRNSVLQAQLEYQQGLANLAVQEEQNKLAVSTAVLKRSEIIAEGQLAILKATTLEDETRKRGQLEAAVAAQNGVIRGVVEQGVAQQIINKYAAQNLGYAYQSQVVAAGYALQQKLISDRIGMSTVQANSLTQGMVNAATSTQTMTNTTANLTTKMGEAAIELKTGTDAALQNVQVFGTAAVQSAQSQDTWRESVLRGVGAQQQVSAAVQQTTETVVAANNIRATSAIKTDAEVVKSNAAANKKITEASGFSVKRLQDNWTAFTTYFSTNVTTPIAKLWNAMIKALPNAMQSAANLIQSVWSTVLGQIRGFFNSFITGILNNVNSAIGAINSVIGAYNRLPTPPFPDVGYLGYIQVPAFAEGGIVDRPTLAMVGEGGEREFIIPESKMAATSANYLTGGGGRGDFGGGTAQISITTGPVVQMDGEQYVTLPDLERAMQMTADGVYKSLRTSAGRYAVGTR